MQIPSDRLKHLLATRDPAFWEALTVETQEATELNQVLSLSKARRRGLASFANEPLKEGETLRLALVGGITFHPLDEAIEQIAFSRGLHLEIIRGEFDNATGELLDPESAIYARQPQVIVLFPSQRLLEWETDGTNEQMERQAKEVARGIHGLCEKAREHSKADLILCNYPLPGHSDLGSYRAKKLSDKFTFRKLVNLEIGLRAPDFVHLCDLEFLSAQVGTRKAYDARAWFESKQLGAMDFLVPVAREITQVVWLLRNSSKKVLVTDLDNTLWGGVIGDDGLEGIELGDTSPRGEAFKAFQRYLKLLAQRGVMLAVCSKNNPEIAREPFLQHPEMILKLEDFAAFQANWNPKPENLKAIAAALNVGLDTLVFVDDNPAEIDIVRQFLPEVRTILLGPDPADYVGQVKDGRDFETLRLTAEDAQRSRQYHQERERSSLRQAAVDMPTFLASLEMRAILRPFGSADQPRIAQLINKSNQFNLTTRRRSESEVAVLMQDRTYCGFTLRLADRFGDHGLVTVAIGKVISDVLEIDTWLMSCRVLERQAEEEVLNELVRLARERGCKTIRGVYLPTAKNAMVRDHYARLGFTLQREDAERREFVLALEGYRNRETKILIEERAGR